MNQMKCLVLQVKGKMAHFRNITSTIRARSYSFPPKTTVAGLLGAIVGVERYNLPNFARSLLVALKIDVPPRKLIFSINNLKIKTRSFKQLCEQLRGSGGHTQQATEILLPQVGQTLQYTCFLMSQKQNLLKMIFERIKNKNYSFPPSLGPANFPATINIVSWGRAEKITLKEPVVMDSVIAEDEIEDIVPIPGCYHREGPMPTQLNALRENIGPLRWYYYATDLTQTKILPSKAKVKRAFQVDYCGRQAIISPL